MLTRTASVNSTFYHGTSLEAALSIQRAGFDAELSGSNAGTLLGRGVYVTNVRATKSVDSSSPFTNAFCLTWELLVSQELIKALQYTATKPHGGCILQLEVDIGDCLHLDSGNLEMRKTWQEAGYDSAHAAEGVLKPGSKVAPSPAARPAPTSTPNFFPCIDYHRDCCSKEEYCIKDPMRVRQLCHVTLCDTSKAKAAGFKTVAGSEGPLGCCPYWQDWVRNWPSLSARSSFARDLSKCVAVAGPWGVAAVRGQHELRGGAPGGGRRGEAADVVRGGGRGGGQGQGSGCRAGAGGGAR